MNDALPVSAYAETAQQVLRDMLREMTFPGVMTVEVAESPEQIVLTIAGNEPMGLLIGKGGQTLNAIELIVRTIVQHKTGSHGKPITVDAEGYRARQAERLVEIARDAAKEAIDTGGPVALAPMNPRDRRTVHMALAEIPGVTNASEGEDQYRHIVVYPAGMAPAAPPADEE